MTPEAPDAAPPGEARARSPLRPDASLLLELFVAANLLFLALDVWLAHAANDFARASEWIPVVFAAVGGAAVAGGLAAGVRGGGSRGWRKGAVGRSGLIVGWGSVLLGIVGLVLHLESQFFRELTLRSLVYSAPFVAPLSFAGLGFLLLLNRMVDPDGIRWPGWILLLALGGFVGNFVLSLADHAQNGFFYATEWVPVAAAALAVGYLSVLFFGDPDDGYLRLGYWTLGLQAAVGAVGFVLHAGRLIEPSPASLAERVVHGAPLFAPLLFLDLAALAGLGLRDFRDKRLGLRVPPSGREAGGSGGAADDPGAGGEAGADPGRRAPV